MPDLLQAAYDLGCDFFLTGIVEHRWAVPFIQEGNRKFHELNEKPGLNLIRGTHFGTERPAMIEIANLFKSFGFHVNTGRMRNYYRPIDVRGTRLKRAWRYDMQFDLESARQILQRTPSTLASLVRDLPEGWVRHDEGPGTWSVFDVVGHLIHGERTDWMPRARIILAHGPRMPFEPFDRVAQLKEGKGRSLSQLLDEFSVLRAQNLDELAGLRLVPEQLALEGRHPELGKVTLGQLLSTWVVHDLDHLVQVARVMAKCYTEEVGPWREYLRVLS